MQPAPFPLIPYILVLLIETMQGRQVMAAEGVANGSRGQEVAPRSVAVWLFACAGMVLAMMIIGAITRLTESGLSMVEWRPLLGAMPPWGAEEWNRVFALYKETSEYQLANAGMTLSEFQTIFWWEFIHRLWGGRSGWCSRYRSGSF